MILLKRHPHKSSDLSARRATRPAQVVSHRFHATVPVMALVGFDLYSRWRFDELTGLPSSIMTDAEFLSCRSRYFAARAAEADGDAPVFVKTHEPQLLVRCEELLEDPAVVFERLSAADRVAGTGECAKHPGRFPAAVRSPVPLVGT